MKTQLKWLAVGAIALGAVQAQAADTNWGTHEAVEFGSDKVSAGPIADSFDFLLTQTSSLVASAVSNNLGAAFNIDGGMVQLFKVDSGTDTLIGSFGFDGTTGSTPHTFDSLTSGDYFYSVTGDATGHAGGWYSLTSATSAVAAVPEPGITALLGAGLGVLALVARRRRPLQR